METVDKKKLAADNLGLVHLCANRFRGKSIEYDDLYGAGCVGLMKAVNAFDFDRGVKFSTYAVPVILGEIKRLFRDGGTVKVSRSLKELSLRVTRSRESFVKEHGREPTINELAKLNDTDVEGINEALNVAMPPVSLTGTTDDSGSEIDIPIDSPDEKIADSISLRQVLGKLDKKDRDLIFLRYIRRKTQSETAKILGMTQVQVSRYEKKLLLKLRQEFC